MPSITIRDVPQDARDELASRAARSGRSLQEFLHRLLVDAANTADIDDLVVRISERKHRSRGRVTTDAILAARDADRR